jgi:hypothetical protein
MHEIEKLFSLVLNKEKEKPAKKAHEVEGERLLSTPPLKAVH